jgi:hypothetical protein
LQGVDWQGINFFRCLISRRSMPIKHAQWLLKQAENSRRGR